MKELTDCSRFAELFPKHPAIKWGSSFNHNTRFAFRAMRLSLGRGPGSGTTNSLSLAYLSSGYGATGQISYIPFYRLYINVLKLVSSRCVNLQASIVSRAHDLRFALKTELWDMTQSFLIWRPPHKSRLMSLILVSMRSSLGIKPTSYVYLDTKTVYLSSFARLDLNPAYTDRVLTRAVVTWLVCGVPNSFESVSCSIMQGSTILQLVKPQGVWRFWAELSFVFTFSALTNAGVFLPAGCIS